MHAHMLMCIRNYICVDNDTVLYKMSFSDTLCTLLQGAKHICIIIINPQNNYSVKKQFETVSWICVCTCDIFVMERKPLTALINGFTGLID